VVNQRETPQTVRIEQNSSFSCFFVKKKEYAGLARTRLRSPQGRGVVNRMSPEIWKSKVFCVHHDFGAKIPFNN